MTDPTPPTWCCMTRPTGEDEMSSEHVEVLRNLSEVCRAAIKAGDWKVDGACDPDAVLRRADSAIAALSAPQPPAEAQSGDWVLVPREPTPEMANWFRADEGSATFFTHTTIQCADFGSRYSAMLAAAPQPPAEAQAVAWEWEYIGGDHYPRGHKVARSLREMDPTNPPYPETWRPTRPLIYGDTPPPSAPVGVDGLPERWRREAPLAKMDSGEDAARAYREAVYWCAFQLEAALAQQPAAVECDCPAGRIDHASWCAVSKAQDAALAAQPGGSDNDR